MAEYKFSAASMRHLSEAHPDLQRLFAEVIRHHDCTVIDGHRPKAEQDKAFNSRKSKVAWPNSKHNKDPALAVDVIPYPISWSDDPKNLRRYYHFAGIVLGIASQLDIPIRWGGDWDGDDDFYDQSFNDFPHFGLIPKPR